MSKTLSVIYEKDETGYFVATCPTIEGCYTQGKTLEEAKENIKEVIEMCLEEPVEDNWGESHD